MTRILVVDDSEDVRDIFTAALEEHGYSDVIAVESAAAALELLSLDVAGYNVSPAVDLIFLDVVMPKTDGIQLCAQIRQAHHYDNVPIVMITARDDVADLDRAFGCGATDYLTKPVKVVDLVACVRSNIKLREEFNRRSALEDELSKHLPFCFDAYVNDDKESWSTMPSIWPKKLKVS